MFDFLNKKIPYVDSLYLLSLNKQGVNIMRAKVRRLSVMDALYSYRRKENIIYLKHNTMFLWNYHWGRQNYEERCLYLKDKSSKPIL